MIVFVVFPCTKTLTYTVSFRPLRAAASGEEQKHKTAQDEAEILKVEADKVSGLEAASTELQSKVSGLKRVYTVTTKAAKSNMLEHNQ